MDKCNRTARLSEQDDLVKCGQSVWQLITILPASCAAGDVACQLQPTRNVINSAHTGHLPFNTLMAHTNIMPTSMTQQRRTGWYMLIRRCFYLSQTDRFGAIELLRCASLIVPYRPYWQTRKPCCRRETARCRCKFWSISIASWAKAEWMRNWKYHLTFSGAGTAHNL